MRITDFPVQTPHLDRMLADGDEFFANGGSCVAGPDGQWAATPVTDKEKLIVVNADHGQVCAERQNFDPAGHYARPDVTQL